MSAFHVVWGKVDDSEASSHTEGSKKSAEEAREGDVTYLDHSSSEVLSSSLLGESLRTGGRPDPGRVTEDEGQGEAVHVQTDYAGELPPDQAKTWTVLERVVDKGGAWSLGSSPHAVGKCIPCHWIHSRNGCKRERECGFCHIPHTHSDITKVGDNRKNQCAKFCAAFVAGYNAQKWDAPFRDLSLAVSSHSGYLRALLNDEAANVDGGAPLSPQGRGRMKLSL
mmetsp:Transcript_117916/g.338147  ORF Transcript_117916/g.338147 Transcript_117916/m.338147 type:complete len:224 (-) Transcript_117916:97-768(-)|eukprot:CAMPEP_0170302954 /NCGR_PEP_ID=MMETSP0116_2-20130129/51780_1 /TAXON_ID=400756 /ORGANISM="Durinskia baltica, Strain CSIRO CS-38" /LENGTH=223 /DNA_ID=CAMNT_0010554863 /DNA_START=46 /DNA_END=717 /DNA_ORIENTATION=-